MRRIVALLVALSAGWSAGALAQEEPVSPAVAEARQRFDLGTNHAEQGDWALALAEWERVRSILEAERHPNASYVTYNIARANEELGRTGEAIEAYERYLAATADDPNAPNRADADRHLRELRLRRELQGGGETQSGGGFSPSPIGIVIAAVGAASMIAGGVVGGIALAQDGDARASCEETRCTPDAHAAIGDAHTLANAADGLLWGGLAVLATGVVLTFVLGESGEARASAACDGEGCVAVVRGVF